MKLKLRPSLPLLIAGALSLLLLAGCGTSDKASEPSASSAPGQGLPSETASHPVVTIEMEDGGIIAAELYPEVAPNTVNNFISLIHQGFYDGTVFHRVIPGFMIQGGDPDGTGDGGPGYTIAGEFTGNGFVNNLKHTAGVLSMARLPENFDSAGSQFFIMTDDAPHLDGGYAAFGKVTDGMDVVKRIAGLERDDNDRPTHPPAIKKVTVDTLGVTYPEPTKMQ